MTLYSDPPTLRDYREDKPTLLVCWWMTSFCALMIILRVVGRFIRTEKLFLEDKIASLALVPLFLRMVCLHFVLRYGTNNADFSRLELTPTQLRQKSIASGLVLASRIFYGATLWILKLAILEFLRRLTDLTWSRSHQVTLIAIRLTLALTFVAVVVGTLVECSPFRRYWQVLPDPGGQCRQAYVQLITMTTCNVVTDALLVFFPIPIIVRSQMKLKRKIHLILLFSLSLSVVVVTLYRLPRTMEERGGQQIRSLLASVELLFATAAANALVLGSFVRDRGIKKQKFHRNSAADSFDRSSSARRPTLQQQWGSDEDLVRDVGLSVDPELQEPPRSPATEHFSTTPVFKHREEYGVDWQGSTSRASNSEHSDDLLVPLDPLSKTDPRKRRLSFLDVGGLLDGEAGGGTGGGYRRGSGPSSTPAPGSPYGAPPASVPASTVGVRRGSAALLQDLDGLAVPASPHPSRARARGGSELEPIPQKRPVHLSSSQHDLEFADPGGLLK
ncbi:integral membrane protein [Drechmeria coniospora]|uniref:Integral membrane protein n=1 Tax=Drechmeria coniospora TaxID=98403 RepID=A0A151GQJ4_DRECN|nr:integral membrane protein [Drechmeria coniospora]KYK59394.1 integral membrane protein [Drechmeria coniospora]ODA76361.1 hypothetical protein RJ55_08207 [Drechmeria coniospora]